jgi:4-hydroxybenzoate polyprenyltransferase
VGLIAAGAFALYQQWLILERKPDQCFKAFLNNNWLGISILLGIVVDYALR